MLASGEQECKWEAERQPSAAAGSGSGADAGGSQLQGVVRLRLGEGVSAALCPSADLSRQTHFHVIVFAGYLLFTWVMKCHKHN